MLTPARGRCHSGDRCGRHRHSVCAATLAVRVIESEVRASVTALPTATTSGTATSSTGGWGEGPAVVWVLLNPATGSTDGKQRPTLGRCIRWSQAWGYGVLTIVNLFAYWATKPKDFCWPTIQQDHRTTRRSRRSPPAPTAWWPLGGARTPGWSRTCTRRAAARRAVPRPYLEGPAAPPAVRPEHSFAGTPTPPPCHHDAPRFDTVWPTAGTQTLLAVVNKGGRPRWQSPVTRKVIGVVIIGQHGLGLGAPPGRAVERQVRQFASGGNSGGAMWATGSSAAGTAVCGPSAAWTRRAGACRREPRRPPGRR